MHPIVEKIQNVFERRGADRYGEEHVTQLQHALQSGLLARQAGESDQLITAALLHDIGHILAASELPEDCDANLDDKHEDIGYEFLSTHFGEPVAAPVRLHVVAKRYLCTKHEDYEGKLSPTSRKSYHDQGGKMSADEVAQFESDPYYRDALKLRHWDDTAKDPNQATPCLAEFQPHLEASLLNG